MEPEKLAAPAVPAKPATPAAAKADGVKKASQTVRVDIGRLDKLMNLVGELVIGRARIERLVQEARLREFDEPLSQLGRISGDIQELVTKLRMVPVSFTFDRFPRLIRDHLSKSSSPLHLRLSDTVVTRHNDQKITTSNGNNWVRNDNI